MNLSTLCLNLCFLLVTCCPSIAMQAIFGKNSNGYGFNLYAFLRAVLVYYGIVLTTIYILWPQIHAPLGEITSRLVIIGLVLLPLVLIIEVTFLHMLRCFQKKQWLPLKLSFVGTTQKWQKIAYPLLLAFCEEITYRFLWFAILYVQWQLPIILVLFLSSFCYALNHLLMGESIFYGKILTGLLYGCIYCFSQNFWLVVFVHVGGNFVVECFSYYQLKVRR